MGDGLAQAVDSEIQVGQGARHGWGVGGGVEEDAGVFWGADAATDQGLYDEGMAADGVAQRWWNVNGLGIQPSSHSSWSDSQVVGSDLGV